MCIRDRLQDIFNLLPDVTNPVFVRYAITIVTITIITMTTNLCPPGACR